MIAWDTIGYVASALVLAAFCMKEMMPLRAVAVCSNIAFLSYGLALGLAPVWFAARRLAANKLLATMGRHVPTAVRARPASPLELSIIRRAITAASTPLRGTLYGGGRPLMDVVYRRNDPERTAR